MEKADIITRVISTLSRCANLTPDQLAPLHWKDPLTGHMFNLFAEDLVYLLFEVEREFNIKISASFLMEYGFSSIDNICTVVQKSLEYA